MDTSPLQLTPEMRDALAANPDTPAYICDEQTRRVYLLMEQGKFPELEEEYIRACLEEARMSIERGEIEEWDVDSIKKEGRHLLAERQSRS